MTGSVRIHAADAEAEAVCPRCGAGFHCGANDAAPCACAGLALSDALRAGLRMRYTGCLCLACLAALCAGDAHEKSRPGLATGRP